MTLEHHIDLSSVQPRPGQSTDLEAKRRRAWDALSVEDRQGAIRAYGLPVEGWQLQCHEAGGAYERTLYVLVVTGARLTPEQIAYLSVARWYRNVDPGTVRARLADMVRRGHARWTKDGRFYASDDGVFHMRAIENAWLVQQRARMKTSGPAHGLTAPASGPAADSVAPISGRPADPGLGRPLARPTVRPEPLEGRTVPPLARPEHVERRTPPPLARPERSRGAP